MKPIVALFIIGMLFVSCEAKKETSSINPENWEKRTINYTLSDTLETGTTYLSVYSQIYSIAEHRTHGLTATISLRNTNRYDSVFILKAEYFNTKGELIRTYFNKPIYIKPLETVEIIIAETDKEGGSGANFIFEWKKERKLKDPFFEGVMISTSGQQGLSFTTQGIKIEP